MSHGEPFLLRDSGVAGSRGLSPTALIFSFNWPEKEETHDKETGQKQNEEKPQRPLILFFPFQDNLCYFEVEICVFLREPSEEPQGVVFRHNHLLRKSGYGHTQVTFAYCCGIMPEVSFTQCTARMNFSFGSEFSVFLEQQRKNKNEMTGRDICIWSFSKTQTSIHTSEECRPFHLWSIALYE